ncbi:hypothetical protein BB560_003547 [Smittium megazygosporum]|uniref:SET domain-containing protein n=1 Tax=Smittium megazygosporum TaxID=133381 RepID=A0A2T9ZBS9_9FUNG|nr:hypothetical protein BB560_003547 [Smittium megazygosporum]
MVTNTHTSISVSQTQNHQTPTMKSKKVKKQSKVSSFSVAEDSFPVEFKNTLAKGKHLLTKQDIKAGSVVLTEVSPVFIPKYSSSFSLCHSCLEPVPKVSVQRPKSDNPNETETVEEPKFKCESCQFAVYCSTTCMEKEKELHELECNILKGLLSAFAENPSGSDFLRVLLRIHFKIKLQKDTSFVPGSDQETPISLIEETPNHRETFEKGSLEKIASDIRQLTKLVPELNNAKSISNLTTHACRFFSNNTQFYEYFYRGVFDAVGLFPMVSSYVKHSCIPNCIISGEKNGKIVIRALMDIPKGIELTCSQTELYQPREHRRRDLLINRHIWCKCRRCSSTLSKSVDRFMDGIVCKKCHAGLLIFEETKEVEDISDLMKNAAILDDEIKGKNASCSNCGNQISVTALVDILKEAIQKFNVAFNNYRHRNIEQARKLFESYLKEFDSTRTLHVYNSYIVNSLIPLTYCCRALNDYPSAISNCKRAIEYMTNSGALPKNYPDITELRVTLGELLLEYAQKKTSTGGWSQIQRNVIKRHYAEAKKVLQTALEEREIVVGKQHHRYIQLLTYINFVDRASQEFESPQTAANPQQNPTKKGNQQTKTQTGKENTSKKTIKKVLKKPPQEILDQIASKSFA